jgi:hypothetical protein
MVPIGYYETSATNYQSMLGNIPEERFDLFYIAAKLQSHTAFFYRNGKEYFPQPGPVSFQNSHDVPTEKVAGASHVTSTVTGGNKVKRVAHYIRMEFA